MRKRASQVDDGGIQMRDLSGREGENSSFIDGKEVIVRKTPVFDEPTIAARSVKKQAMRAMESLDYQIHDCILFREQQKNTGKLAKIATVGAQWLIFVAIGVLVGLAAFLIKWGIQILTGFRFSATLDVMATSTMGWSVLGSLIIYTVIGVSYAVLACCVVLLFGPPAQGSGIPEVMGYLNGVRVEHTINIKTFLGKVLSLILAYSSGLALGPEGPMIHIGSMIGGGMGQAKHHTKNSTPGLYPNVLLIPRFRNDRDQRDFISGGAASGISAAFGAPVGGLLFSIEEASSFWSDSLTWRTFFCCMISAFTVNITMNGFSADITDTGMFKLGLSGEHLYHYLELIPFLIIGVIGGLFGALFNYLSLALAHWRKVQIQTVRRKLSEVAIVALVTCLLTFIVSYFWTCSSIKSFHVLGAPGAHPVELTKMYCPEGQYSELASMVFTPPDVALKTLFSRTQGLYGLWALSVFVMFYFTLSVVTCGLTVTGGLFIPMMLTGAAVGRFVGELVFLMFPEVPIDPSIYALIGSAATMTGFCRLTLSIVVITVELTENTQYLLPIILCVMIAKWTADIFGHSLYLSQMEDKCIPYLPSTPTYGVTNLSVVDVMSADVVTLKCIEKIDIIIKTLESNTHNGFPVVANAWDYEVMMRNANVSDDEGSMMGSERGGSKCEEANKKFQGLILRKHLLAILYHVLRTQMEKERKELLARNKKKAAMASAVEIEMESLEAAEEGRTNKAAKEREEKGKETDKEKEGAEKKEHEDGNSKEGEKKESNGDTTSEKNEGNNNNVKASPRDGGEKGKDSEGESKVSMEMPSINGHINGADGAARNRIMECSITYSDFYRADYPPFSFSSFTERQREMYIDLRPYINFSAYTVTNTWSLNETYQLFRTMGMRHLTVLDDCSQVVGIVTRNDLL